RSVDALAAEVAVLRAQIAELERQRRESEVVADLARTVNASLDLDTVLHRVAAAARDLCGSDLAHIALRDRNSQSMRLRSWAGDRTTGPQSFRVGPGKGVGGQVLVTGRPFRTDDVTADHRVTGYDVATVRAERIIASMAVPIRVRDRIVGLLIVDN